jgi:hypothetical protein
VSVYRGDCLAWLRSLEDESVDAVVTDPPYGLSKPPRIEDVLRAWLDGEQYQHGGGGFMGHEWDAFVPGPAVWREVARVLKPGGHAVVFAGTRTVDVMGIALRLAGLEVRDLGRWCYWSGFPKSMDVSKAIDKAAGAERERRMVPTKVGNKPSQEGPISCGASGMRDVSAPATPEAEAWAGWGTALKPAGEPWLLVRKPMRGTTVAQVLATGTGALNIDGCRYPDGDDAWPGPYEVLRAQRIYATPGSGRTMSSKGWTPGYLCVPHDDGRWPANLYASSKASRAERERGCDDLPARAGAGVSASSVRNHHPTVKPVRLMRWLVRLVTPPGGVVIDPYLGSGTTGIAATLEGVRWAGAELLDDHADIAEARIAHAARWPEAWGDTTPGGGVSTDERATLERRGQLGMFGGSDE